MHSIFSRGILKPAGWLALCYLGYWLALVIDRILVQSVAFPLLGMGVTSWEITPFRITIANSTPEGLHSNLFLALALPLVLEVVFLSSLSRWGTRFRSAFVRTGIHFAGLWIVLLLAMQGAVLAYWGHLRLGQFSVQLAALGPSRLPLGIVITLAATSFFLGFGGMCARRLLDDARKSLELGEGAPWFAALFLILPVLVILSSAFRSALRFLGWRAIAYILVPAGLCLLLALIGLWRKPILRQATGLSSRGAWVAVCVACIVFGALQQSASLRVWAMERPLARSASSHWEILYDPRNYSAAQIAQFAQAQEANLTRLSPRLNVLLDGMHLRIVLYPDFPSKQSATGNKRPYTVAGTTIRTVLGGYVDHLDPAADAAALLYATWGPPGTARMGEWVARWLASEWHSADVLATAAQIEREVGHYTQAQLVASSSDGWLPPLVREPLGAAWVSTVFDRRGLAGVRKLYSAQQPDLNVAGLARLLDAEPTALERDWQQWAAKATARWETQLPPGRLLDPNFFFRGIGFSHEGWTGVGGGYSSPEGAAQLRRLRALGANAIAVVPYGFARGANEQTISYTGTDETDEELTEALYVAHQLGMKVMLKPQLWLKRGDFTGTLRFDDPAVRGAWMHSYREFILHYARLAELEHFDLLSIGTELEGLTPYEADWRRLIADVRRVYHGPLTYAANWGHEFESVGFWDALEYMGVNNYYPLAAAPSARVEDLLPGAERLAAKLEAVSRRWHKPILFTEAGYPSVRGGASEPWVEDAGRGISLEEQAAAYEAIFRAFSGRPWFRGMFWWKWPSSGRGGGPRDASYTPLGKPAAEVLHAWFTRLAGASKSTATQTP